jgi:CBS domain-containing protein
MKSEITVEQVLLPLDRIPVLKPQDLFRDALEAMSQARLGIVSIVDSEGKLIGIVTDGDVRRVLLNTQKPLAALFMDDVITHSMATPTTVELDSSLADAVDLMGQKQIWDLPVVDGDGRLCGLLHLHPAIEALMEYIE